MALAERGGEVNRESERMGELESEKEKNSVVMEEQEVSGKVEWAWQREKAVSV
jgi:hypothetical protein